MIIIKYKTNFIYHETSNKLIRLFGSAALTGQKTNESQVIRLSGVYCNQKLINLLMTRVNNETKKQLEREGNTHVRVQKKMMEEKEEVSNEVTSEKAEMNRHFPVGGGPARGR